MFTNSESRPSVNGQFVKGLTHKNEGIAILHFCLSRLLEYKRYSSIGR